MRNDGGPYDRLNVDLAGSVRCLTCRTRFAQIDGVRPDIPTKAIEATCTFFDEIPGNSSSASKATSSKRAKLTFYEVKGKVHSYPNHPGDRYIGHSFAFWVDCQLPEHLQDRKDDLGRITMDVAFNAGTLTVPTHKDYLDEANRSLILTATALNLTVTPPKSPHVELAVCVTPTAYGLEPLPLHRLLEWRLYLADVGVER